MPQSILLIVCSSSSNQNIHLVLNLKAALIASLMAARVPSIPICLVYSPQLTDITLPRRDWLPSPAKMGRASSRNKKAIKLKKIIYKLVLYIVYLPFLHTVHLNFHFNGLSRVTFQYLSHTVYHYMKCLAEKRTPGR
jgi:hypothetical protein